ncbi:MAG: hypothetical protein NTZ22_07160, partial [Hyphomicrobiales bacterium]|nr:hypothetical protein [Hyphomicrobiales bacterium]
MQNHSIRDRIIDATMLMAAHRDWDSFDIADVARQADVGLSEFRECFPSKGAVLAGLARRIDQAVLADEAKELAGEPAREEQRQAAGGNHFGMPALARDVAGAQAAVLGHDLDDAVEAGGLGAGRGEFDPTPAQAFGEDHRLVHVWGLGFDQGGQLGDVSAFDRLAGDSPDEGDTGLQMRRIKADRQAPGEP